MLLKTRFDIDFLSFFAEFIISGIIGLDSAINFIQKVKIKVAFVYFVFIDLDILFFLLPRKIGPGYLILMSTSN